MAHCNLQLYWKRLEILRNKSTVHGPLEFTIGLEAFRILEKQKARAWPTVIWSWTGIVRNLEKQKDRAWPTVIYSCTGSV